MIFVFLLLYLQIRALFPVHQVSENGSNHIFKILMAFFGMPKSDGFITQYMSFCGFLWQMKERDGRTLLFVSRQQQDRGVLHHYNHYMELNRCYKKSLGSQQRLNLQWISFVDALSQEIVIYFFQIHCEVSPSFAFSRNNYSHKVTYFVLNHK